MRQYPDSFWMFRSVLVWFYLSYGWFGKFSKSVVEVCVHPEVLKVLMLPTLAVHTICCFDLTYTVHNVQAWAHNVSQFWRWGTGVGDTPFILSRLIALLHALIVTSTVEVHGWQTRKLSSHQTAIHMDYKIWVVISDEHWLFYTGDGTWIVLYPAPFCCRSHIEISLQTGF